MTTEEVIRQLKVLKWINEKLYKDRYSEAIDKAIEIIERNAAKREREEDDEDGWL